MFEGLAADMRGALGRVALRVEHVGSTAVPGLPAKPVIDIQLSVAALDPSDAYVEPLAGLGYRYRSEDDMPAEHRVLLLEREDRRLVNLHVCRAGSEWERRHVAFRDHLRADPEARAEYGAVKERLIREFPTDVHAYAQAKTPVIRRLERRALDLPEPPHDPDPVVIAPSDRAWPSVFEKEASRVRAEPRMENARLEHVGATAVEGLAGDLTVDMLLPVGPDDGSRRAALEALGYRLTSDPGPGTLFVRQAARRRFHLRLVDAGGEDHRSAVALRDYLRVRPEQADRFGRLKAILAEELRFDRAGYAHAKGPYLWVMGQRRKEEGFDVA